MRRQTLAVAVFMLCGGVALPQGPSQKPQPGPEHKKLAYMVGKWSSEGELKPSAFGPGGKMTSKDSCEWFSGGFAVVCHGDAKSPMGDVRALSIMSYDPGEQRYIYFETNTSGENVVAKGTIEGQTWTWTGESRMGGKVFRNRFIFTEVPPDGGTYKFEMAEGDGPWAEIMQGKQTRVK